MHFLSPTPASEHVHISHERFTVTLNLYIGLAFMSPGEGREAVCRSVRIQG